MNKPLEIAGLALELLQDTVQLGVDRLGHIENQPDQPKRLSLGLGKASRFIKLGIVQ